MPHSFTSIGIIGAGAWGTALALAVRRTGSEVTLWALEPEVAAEITEKRKNTVFLPGIDIPPEIRTTSELSDLTACKMLILATPAQHLRAMCQNLARLLKQPVPLVIASKGIEKASYRLMSEVVAEELPGFPIYILSGPSFAKEVAQNLPAALTLASEHDVETVAQALSSPCFRLYTTDDIIGAQIGGAVKNVLAIACGIISGRHLGENARAGLITRGLAEIVRLAKALGARTETLMGLSGIGDVVLTCSSLQSRNMSLGFELGQGKNLQAILAERKSVAEGLSSAAATLGLARRHGVDMPVVSAVDMVLRDMATIDESIKALLSRPLKKETL
ncbi:MAG: NAD(P)-dependent glycerol-3-phosphate dehydrogenase [Alphaproteobacteria bacterium]|nr:NAD(P)-dependent glycerol-3-phosphate dehydrogenase [Alphaproteobacteria bacterium]